MFSRNRAKKVLPGILCGLILSSCGSFYRDKTSRQDVGKSSLTGQGISFASVKERVFSDRCTSCHRHYDQYTGVIAEISAIRSAVTSGRMPKTGGPLSDAQMSLLLSWIDRGAPEFLDSPADILPPAARPLLPDWSSLSEKIFYPKCVACHNPTGQANFLDLSSRESIWENRDRASGNGSRLINFDVPEESVLIQVLIDSEEPMPPLWSNLPRLEALEIETIRRWIELKLPLTDQ